MTTIVNSQPPANESNGIGFLLGVLVLVGFLMAFIYYGLPAIRNMQIGTPQINIPNKIDVNVKQTK